MSAAIFPHGNAGYDVKLTGPVVFAIGLHVLLALLLWVSSWFSWNHTVTSAAGSTMDATMDTTAAEDRAVRQAIRADVVPLPPDPEPIVEEAVPPPVVEQQIQPQEIIPVPDKINQDEARSDAIAQEKALKEQEEKRKQEQIDLAAERERQKQAEEKQRLAKQQADEQARRDEDERQKKIAEARRKTQQAAREAEQEEKKKQQIDTTLARGSTVSTPATATGTSAPVGQGGTDDGLSAKYIAAITEAVSRQWTRPDSVPIGAKCRIIIKQLPGGEVIDAQVQPGCAMDRAGQDSLERAVLKAQPLPYRGFESVFNRQLNFNFTAQDR
jgi:colicin import membrane protein